MDSLPLHLIHLIASNLPSLSRVVFSTCHPRFSRCGWLEHVMLDVLGEETVISFSRWLSTHPSCVKVLVLRDRNALLDTFPVLCKRLQRALLTQEQTLTDVVVRSSFLPDTLIPSLPFLKRVRIDDGPYPQTTSLAHMTHLESITITHGLGVMTSAGFAELGGLSEPPRLRELSIQRHLGWMCLCTLPKVQALEYLEIVGTHEAPIIIRDLRPLKELPALKHIVLDSSSHLLGRRVPWTRLDTLDLSKRHPDYEWTYRDIRMERAPSFERLVGCVTHLGCRDVLLGPECSSMTLQTLTMTPLTLVHSLFMGWSLELMPHVHTLILDSACSFHDLLNTPLLEETLAGMVRRHPQTARLVLQRPFRDSMAEYTHLVDTTALTHWFRLVKHTGIACDVQ